MPADAHGQAGSRFVNQERREDRSINELLGLCHGLIADGVVNQDEAEYLQKWLNSNRHVLDKWPANIIADRVYAFLQDGILDAEEQKELFDILASAVGADRAEAKLEETVATTLPFDNPLPAIKIPDREFCLTGKFVLGTRKQVEQQVKRLGGFVRPNVTVGLDYLVVGDFGSRDWIQSAYGRKIERAVELREERGRLAIISEQAFVEALVALENR